MRRFLLDVNVLIALIDPRHLRHNHAHDWFAKEGHQSWASCPLTQLGVLRVVGHASYPNSPGSLSVVAASLKSLCAAGDHEFWPDNLTLLEGEALDLERVSHTAQLTDTYLLALAAANNGKLATYDRRVVTNAVSRGRQMLHLLEP